MKIYQLSLLLILLMLVSMAVTQEGAEEAQQENTQQPVQTAQAPEAQQQAADEQQSKNQAQQQQNDTPEVQKNLFLNFPMPQAAPSYGQNDNQNANYQDVNYDDQEQQPEFVYIQTQDPDQYQQDNQYDVVDQSGYAPAPAPTPAPAPAPAPAPRPLERIFRRQPSRTAPISQLRDYFVYLTNILRAKYNAPKVSISPFLCKIAQAHSVDMVRRNFFDHKNPDGESVGQRANRNKYYGRIGQNLALAYSLDQAQNGFINSPGHFKNAINKVWDQIGVGIAFKGQAYLVTVLFTPRDISRKQLSSDQINGYKNSLIQVILSQNPNVRGVDRKLCDIIQKWMEGNRRTKLFDYVMAKGGYRASMVALLYQTDFSRDFVNDIKKSRYFANRGGMYTKFGLGVFNRENRMEINVIYL